VIVSTESDDEFNNTFEDAEEEEIIPRNKHGKE
jgi:hypothetical protein